MGIRTATEKALIKMIVAYQKWFSPDTGALSFRKSICVFYPTCSEYTKEAILKYGPIKGVLFGTKRVLRCHPWQKNHNDPL